MTSEARKYQLKNNHFYTATNKRTNKSFVFGFVNSRTGNVSQREQIKGFTTGDTLREIETVDKVDINNQDVLDLGEFGFARVVTTEINVLEPLQLRFVSMQQADKVMKITLKGAGSINV